MRWGDWLEEQARQREAAGLTRSLHPRSADDETLDLAGNDYLGLARHPDVTEAAATAAKEWGAGAGASRLVTGTTQLHTALESELADFLGQPAALVTSTGYHANLATLTALADRETRIVSDAHVHASLIDAARLSRAEVVVTPHHDLAAVEAALAPHGRRSLVVVESVYSVLGDAAPLVALAELAARHDALLLVDEAHGLGVVGSGGHGLVRDLGLAGHPHVLVTATLSKALGSQGGVVLGDPAALDQLVNRGRAFIYDTALSPPSTAAARAALHHLRRHPHLPALVTGRIGALAGLLGVSPPYGAVLSVALPSPRAALAAQAAAGEAGIRVGCFRPPSTPDGTSRLRITASAGHTDAEWARACGVLASVVEAER